MKKKLVSLIMALSVFIVFTGTTLAAGSSGWVTYQVSEPYCKYIPYHSGGEKPFTFQDYFQKKTNVNNAGTVTYSYRTETVTLGAGCN